MDESRRPLRVILNYAVDRSWWSIYVTKASGGLWELIDHHTGATLSEARGKMRASW